MTYTKNKLSEINKAYPEFDNFYQFKLQPMTEKTQMSYLIGLSKIFSILNKYDASKYTKTDIKTLISHEKFKELSNKSKNYYISHFKKYLNYYKRKDLIDLLPRYKQKEKELDKNELIDRKELDLILRNVNAKKKALIMVLYEGALRRKELVGIKYKNVRLVKEGDNEYANLYIEPKNSKTKGRNIPLRESVPYLKIYFNQNDFKPDDKIFDYYESSITLMFSNLTLKLKNRYKRGKNIWTKHLNPHSFRHSRLIELAGLQLNESTLRKFAGWTKDSGMARIYIHLDDTDVKKAIFRQNGIEEYKKPEIETFKPITCENCGTENVQQNAFCSKCGKVINPKRVVVERLQEKEDIENLKKESKELKEKIDKIEKIVDKVPHVLGLYNTINELFSKNKKFFEFIVENKKVDLDILNESLERVKKPKK